MWLEKLKEWYKKHREAWEKDKEKRILLAHAYKYRNIEKGVITVPKPDYPKPKVQKPKKEIIVEPLYDEYKKAYEIDLKLQTLTNEFMKFLKKWVEEAEKLIRDDR